jgi:hypothetical protein
MPAAGGLAGDPTPADDLGLGQALGEQASGLQTSLPGSLGAQATRRRQRGGLACAHWWGTPWWPDIVTEFLARLEDPHHPHWGNDGDRYARLPTQPAEVADRRQLRILLLDAPEALSDEGAEFCVEAGIGFISEPIRVWKTARS